MSLSKNLKKKIIKNSSIAIMIISLISLLPFAMGKIQINNASNDNAAAVANVEDESVTNEIASNFEVTETSLTSAEITNPALSVRNEYIKIGDTLDLDVLDADTNTVLSNQSDFVWTSSNEDVATIDENGAVTGVGIGYTTITGHNSELGISAQAIINVYNNTEGSIAVPKVVGGANHFVALKSDGTVWTWGYNANGQLGLGDNRNRFEPTKTTLTNVIDIAAGYDFTLVLKSDGTVWATGINKYGQLGDGTTTSSITFHKVKLNGNGDYLENIVQITAGDDTSHALTANGEVYSWGINEYGQLGINSTTKSYYPVKMQKVSNIIQIAAAQEHTVMLNTDGSVWSVGYNAHGQLGINNKTTQKLPQQMLNEEGTGILYGVKEIAAGRHTTYVLKGDGTVWATGKNQYGQVGIGTTKDTLLINQVKTKLEDTESGTEAEYVLDAKHITAAGQSAYISRQKNENGENAGIYVIGANVYGALFTQDKDKRTLATVVETDKDIITMTLTKRRRL